MNSSAGTDVRARGDAAGRGASVVAVIVTYQPDPARLQRLVDAVQSQVAGIVVVDNASAVLPPLPSPAIRLLKLARNTGVGAAQNAGIRAALADHAAHVLLLDQDSMPEPDLVERLLEAGAAASAGGCAVAAVGPLIVDPEGRSEGFVRFRAGRYEPVATSGGEPWIDCDLLIASGMLIPLAALGAIGGMDETLFIDKVDTEWCLRAAARGFRLVGAPRARLHHSLGEHAVRIWLGRWRELRQHQPFRYYYMVRNGLLLRHSPHRTAAWCRADRRQLVSLFVYFGLLRFRGGAPLRMMLRGLVDGLRRISGPLR